MPDAIANLRPYVQALLRVQTEIHKDGPNAAPGSITQLGLAIGIGHALGDDPRFRRAAQEDVKRSLRYIRDAAEGVLPLCPKCKKAMDWDAAATGWVCDDCEGG